MAGGRCGPRATRVNSRVPSLKRRAVPVRDQQVRGGGVLVLAMSIVFDGEPQNCFKRRHVSPAGGTLRRSGNLHQHTVCSRRC